MVEMAMHKQVKVGRENPFFVDEYYTPICVEYKGFQLVHPSLSTYYALMYLYYKRTEPDHPMLKEITDSDNHYYTVYQKNQTTERDEHKKTKLTETPLLNYLIEEFGNGKTGMSYYVESRYRREYTRLRTDNELIERVMKSLSLPTVTNTSPTGPKTIFLSTRYIEHELSFNQLMHKVHNGRFSSGMYGLRSGESEIRRGKINLLRLVEQMMSSGFESEEVQRAELDLWEDVALNQHFWFYLFKEELNDELELYQTEWQKLKENYETNTQVNPLLLAHYQKTMSESDKFSLYQQSKEVYVNGELSNSMIFSNYLFPSHYERDRFDKNSAMGYLFALGKKSEYEKMVKSNNERWAGEIIVHLFPLVNKQRIVLKKPQRLLSLVDIDS